MRADILEGIINEYDEIRKRKEKERDERVKDVYERFPEIEETDRKINSVGSDTLRVILSSPDKKGVREEMSDKFRILETKKKEILKKNGIPLNYDAIQYDCDKCKDTGYDENNGRCSCFKQKLIDRLYAGSNMEGLLDGKSFDLFDMDYYCKNKMEGHNTTPYDNMVKIKERCQKFAENFDNEKKSIMFIGDTGLGKTYLSSCIAREVMDQGRTVAYIRAAKLFSLFEDERFGRAEGETDELCRADLLIIDDLATEVQSKNNSAYILELLNERMSRGKRMIINTNIGFGGLEKLYTKRFTSRLMDEFEILYFYGDDIRKQKLFRSRGKN